jgi:phage terminase small subunit
MSLTTLQRNFIQEYLKDFNGTRAAERAGYSGNDNTLAAIASENLRKPKIAECIEERMEDLVMDANEALARISEIARGEYARYIRPDGTVDIEALVEDNKAHLIKKISDTKWGRRYEFHDMHSALQDIAKIYGKLISRVEHTGKDGGPIQTEDVNETRKRLLAELQKDLEEDDSPPAGELD